MDGLLEIYFLPPMAIARLGRAETPSDSFRWTEATTPTEGPRTRVVPDVSLRVDDDGVAEPHLPSAIVFKDADDAIRPVAPFFELWARVQDARGGTREEAVTPALLSRWRLSLKDIRYEITSANRKAERRTGNAACSFVAREVVVGNDHGRRELKAFSPHTAGQEPLVFQNRPITLGWFQVIRPVDRKSLGVDCNVVRVRFTPPEGAVYGPSNAVSGPAPEVPPGVYEDAATQFGRIQEIVAPENRILNDKTPWSLYVMMDGSYEDPPPQDGYDGAAVGNFQSWGCVDDTSDSVIQATLAVGGRRYRAVARVFSGPPDFAPDRRPVYSIADDIADRELPFPVSVSCETESESRAEVLDFFHRAFETASLFNLDAIRARGLQENRIRFSWHIGSASRDEPKAGEESMTAKDEPYVDKLPALAPQAPSRFTEGTPNNPLPYTSAVPQVHAQMLEESVLLDFFRRRPDHVKRIVRPAYGRFADLPNHPADDADPDFRDPRVFRDQLHDMRMPPYMRDANLQPLSLSRRQYQELMDFVSLAVKSTDSQGAALGNEAHRNKIFPRNLTARAASMVSGNPVTTRMESGVGNCFPGLEFDLRVLDCRFFPGMVFQFVTAPLYPKADAIPNQQGVRLLYTDWLLDPMLPERSETPWVRDLLWLYKGPLAKPKLTTGRWYLDWIEQDGKHVSLTDPAGKYYDGELAWRLVRCLEPNKELRIGLAQRVGNDPEPRVELKGMRRPYVNKAGIFDEAFRPGELTDAMCNPWSHDFRDCACHYWASNHPDVVLRELPPDGSLPEGIRNPSVYMDWLRVRGAASEAAAYGTIAENRVFQIDHYEINQMWQTLPFVLEGREIGHVYQPSQLASRDVPYASETELIEQLENVLAPMELTLAIQYLYALFSLRDSEELDVEENNAYPTLCEDLQVARQCILMVAVSEMTHVRWVNQILWELDRAKVRPDGWRYKPVLRTSKTTNISDPKPTLLRALTPVVLDEFIRTERPQGALTAAYGQCVATLHDPRYPKQALELAMRIDGEGVGHFERFTDLKRVLSAYRKNGNRYPYLRPVTPTLGQETKQTVTLFKKVVDLIGAAYGDEAAGKYASAETGIASARATMIEFKSCAEELAKRGFGVPFLDALPPT